MPDTASSSDAYKAFVQEFTRHARRIFSYILTLTANHDDAEEIFQETSGALWEKFDEYEPGTHFGAWACKVAYFKTLSHQSRRRKSPAPLNEALLASLEQEAQRQNDLTDARRRALTHCCDELPPADRDLLDRRYAEGGDVEQIAHALSRSPISVYRRLAKIHEILFRCIHRKLAEQTP